MAFFPATLEDKYLPCVNAVNCARSMIKIMCAGLNPILNEYDYPEMGVRVGIDVGENVVVQYGWGTHLSTVQVNWEIKKPHFDILGYTISVG